MNGKTVKSNDALRLEFIRSVIRNVSDEQENGHVHLVLLTFIKGSARVRLAPGDEAALNAYLRDVIESCRKETADLEPLIHDVAALAKHIAEAETAPVAIFLRSLCEETDKKTLAYKP